MIKLRDVLTVGRYLVDPDIQEIFAAQTKRMGKMIGIVGKEILKETSDDLEKKWLEYMSQVYATATNRLTDFMNDKLIELKEKNGCTFSVNIKGNSKVRRVDSKAKGKQKATETDSPGEESDGITRPANPTGNECPWLEAIHRLWVSKVKEKLDHKPWESGNSDHNSATKRPKPNQQTSGDDIRHSHKKQQKGGPSS